jgi:uncharacterized Zn-binding protein involved in type VI secretion
MSDLARVAVAGHELAIPIRPGTANDAVVNRPNSAGDPAVDINGAEAARGGQGAQGI